MNIYSNFEKTKDILHRSMDVLSLRREIISDNIANAGVPNFKRSELNFEASLKKALESESQEPSLSMVVTNPKHIVSWKAVDYKSVEPRRVLDYLTSSKNNGNNVDPEQEMMDSLNNQLMYNLETQALVHVYDQVNQVLRTV